MRTWIESIVSELGYIGISLLMFLENVFPPIPSELIMPLAGFTTVQGKLSFIGVVLAGTIGSVMGALPLYYLGRLVGEQRLKAWAEKYGKWLMISAQDIGKADDWFDRHSGKAVFFCRCIPGIRSLISIPAGVAHMHVMPFLLYTALGTSLWTALLAYLGRLLGKNYEQVSTYLGPVAYVVFGIIALAAITWIIQRKRAAD